MEQPTDKQLNYARRLGVEVPQGCDKKALSVLIDNKLGNPPKAPYKAPEGVTSASTSQSVVLNRTEKPHSYEFGKSTGRHKIYYSTVEELKQHIESLKAQGLCDLDDFIDVEKMIDGASH